VNVLQQIVMPNRITSMRLEECPKVTACSVSGARGIGVTMMLTADGKSAALQDMTAGEIEILVDQDEGNELF